MVEYWEYAMFAGIWGFGYYIGYRHAEAKYVIKLQVMARDSRLLDAEATRWGVPKEKAQANDAPDGS